MDAANAATTADLPAIATPTLVPLDAARTATGCPSTAGRPALRIAAATSVLAIGLTGASTDALPPTIGPRVDVLAHRTAANVLPIACRRLNPEVSKTCASEMSTLVTDVNKRSEKIKSVEYYLLPCKIEL